MWWIMRGTIGCGAGFWASIRKPLPSPSPRSSKPGRRVAFEVGEVRGGTIKLEETVLPCGLEAGLEPVLVLINDQKFTKTANCWGVDNNFKGTNTNRIVLFRKPQPTPGNSVPK